MINRRPRLRVLVLSAAAILAAAAFAAVGDASTAATAPANTQAPAITGNATQGQTLTTSSGTWTGTTPITFAYKWTRCDATGGACVDIAGATSQTYTLTGSDVHHSLRSVVTATNSAGSANATSARTQTVSGAIAPANTTPPSITGSTSVGSTLTADKGVWTGDAPITYTYQWKRCDSTGGGCSNIGGETKTTYQLANVDNGHRLRVEVTATNAGGQATVTSNATGTVGVSAPANTSAPAITGTPTQGQVLTVSNGSWTGATPITYAYEWDRCDSSGNNCSAISGETKTTYTAAAADVGHKLRAKVTATNSAGSNAALAAPVGPIASNSTLPPGAVKLPSGEISVPASSIPDTDRLTVSSVKYSPSAIHGKAPVTLTLKVIDQNKYVISGVLVYVLPVPGNWASKAPETPTGQSGTVSITVAPTVKAPKSGSLVLFVRARTPQGNLLAGSSTRRLISVRIYGS